MTGKTHSKCKTPRRMAVTNHSSMAVVATIGLDLGDKHSRFCVLDATGEIVEEGWIPTTSSAMARKFKHMEPQRIVIETGTHANWVHDLLMSLGFEVVVANARKLRAISANERKCDELDARLLAQLGRSDVRLLHPVHVRPVELRQDMCALRARDLLVEMRTKLFNGSRGLAKTMGKRLSGTAAYLHKKPLDPLLEPALQPVMAVLGQLTQEIEAFDKKLEQIARTRYPQSKKLSQVPGVGLITSLYFVLAIGDHRRFKDARAVGAYFGLVPRRDQSGGRDPQLSITKCGEPMGRRLLVQCAHCILGTSKKDTDLRRFGLKRSQQGGKGAKKRAVVATARKLTMLLFALLRRDSAYEPLRNSGKSSAA